MMRCKKPSYLKTAYCKYLRVLYAMGTAMAAANSPHLKGQVLPIQNQYSLHNLLLRCSFVSDSSVSIESARSLSSMRFSGFLNQFVMPPASLSNKCPKTPESASVGEK